MMTPFERILGDLKKLQAELKSSSDALWQIKSALQSAHQEGHEPDDFLPRRLMNLQTEAISKFENSLSELRQLAAKSLGPQLFVFGSKEEVQTFLEIKQTLRYLQNAYMDYQLRETLSHWNAILS